MFVMLLCTKLTWSVLLTLYLWDKYSVICWWMSTHHAWWSSLITLHPRSSARWPRCVNYQSCLLAEMIVQPASSSFWNWKSNSKTPRLRFDLHSFISCHSYHLCRDIGAAWVMKIVTILMHSVTVLQDATILNVIWLTLMKRIDA